jgi:hypothetical protein
MSTGQLGILASRTRELGRACGLNTTEVLAFSSLVAEAYEQGYVDAGHELLPLADGDSEAQADDAGRRAQFILPLPGDPE